MPGGDGAEAEQHGQADIGHRRAEPAIAQQVETVARLSETNSATARETESISANLDRLSSSLKTATGKFHV